MGKQSPFDNSKYLKEQAAEILKRVKSFDKLYLEFGGKLLDDMHASRVLPGYDPKNKINLLCKLKDISEIVMCVSSVHLQENKMRADNNLTYADETIRLIQSLTELGLKVSNVVITLFSGEPKAKLFAERIKKIKINCVFHQKTLGYPSDIEKIVSKAGYGQNPYLTTTSQIVVVTAPGPCSGKLGTCLSQLYHDNKHNIKASYAKFETFPVWNLPLNHEVNIAYEASTADLNDLNVIDPFHLQAYNKIAVNYNRDVESFPLLKNILEKITGESPYKSPTDMGVNKISVGIIDDNAVREAARCEVLRRYYNAACLYTKSQINNTVFERTEHLASILKNQNYAVKDIALEVYKNTKRHTFCIKLKNGELITGKVNKLLNAPSSAVLNAIKHLAYLDDDLLMLSEDILKPILDLKREILNSNQQNLLLQDTLTALSFCASLNKFTKKALNELPNLNGCIAHCTHMLNPNDEIILRQLGITFSCEPVFEK